MKNLFIITAVVSLLACNSTKETISTECCHANSTDLPFEIDSIQNVRQLLDSLEKVPSKNF